MGGNNSNNEDEIRKAVSSILSPAAATAGSTAAATATTTTNNNAASTTTTTSKDVIPTASWPIAVPSSLTLQVVSVIMGNSHWDWAIHDTSATTTEILPTATTTATTTDGTTGATPTTTTTITLPGTEPDYIPKLYWRNSSPTYSKTKLTLSAILPQEAKITLFGSADFTAKSATIFRHAQRVPTLYIYIVSTTSTHDETTLVNLFKGISPTVLYKLSSIDFLSPSTVAYDGMGVDRVANLAAAHSLFPQASSILVIDGGTATTFTTTIPLATTTTASTGTSTTATPAHSNKTNHILASPAKKPGATATTPTSSPTKSAAATTPTLQLAGGIGAGLRLKLRSFHDYTDDIPLVEYSHMMQIMQTCCRTKNPLSFFTNSTTTNNKMDPNVVAKTIVGSILTEAALFLCSVIRQWLTQNITSTTAAAPNDSDDMDVDQPTPSQLQRPVVVITGGDGEAYKMLLQPNHSYVCTTNEMNLKLLAQGQTIATTTDEEDADQENNNSRTEQQCLFHLYHHKYLTHIGVGYVLRKRHLNLVAASSSTGTTTTAAAAAAKNETIRTLLLGQRVAVPNPNRKKNQIVYGTIVEVMRYANIDTDYYSVMYDDTAKIDDLQITVIYDALTLFATSGEKYKAKDEEHKVRMLNKVQHAKDAIAELEMHSPAVQKHVEEAKRLAELAGGPSPDAQNDGIDKDMDDTPAAADKPTPQLPTSRKKRKSGATAPAEAIDPTSYLNRRIAKYFEMDGEDGEKVLVLFFGTIREYVPEENWWHIVYDDDDNEDLGLDQLTSALRLYEATKDDDAKKGNP